LGLIESSESRGYCWSRRTLLLSSSTSLESWSMILPFLLLATFLCRLCCYLRVNFFSLVFWYFEIRFLKITQHICLILLDSQLESYIDESAHSFMRVSFLISLW